jgi:uncharacterized protein
VVEEDVRPAGQTRKRRNWRRRAVITIAVLLVVLIGGTGAGGWYFSGELLVASHSPVEYPVAVTAVNGDQVTLTKTAQTQVPAMLGLVWPHGRAILDPTVGHSGQSVVRRVTKVIEGSLQTGLNAYVDTFVFGGDPSTARGLAFQQVRIPSELGDLPAWLVPGRSGTWVIAVHGYGSRPQEALRVLPTLSSAGMSTLVIDYRNDVGAPASPDGFYHLGDTEWRDVQSSVEYAQRQGATSIILYGWSMGGGTVLTAMHRMPAADIALVRGVVLDSPTVDWNSVIDLQAAQRNLPGFLTWTASRLVERRGGMDLSKLDQRRYESLFTVPMLMFVDTADTTVPTAPAMQLAKARPDVITLVVTDGGDHTGSWNVDPARYESTLSTFLARVG